MRSGGCAPDTIPSFVMLDQHLDSLKVQSTSDDPWSGVRYEWLRRLAPVKIGAIGAKLYVCAFGGRVMGSAATYDIEQDGKLIEAKLALRGRQNLSFRYQWSGFRVLDPWTHAWLVAVGYDRVRGFLVPREEVNLTPMKESYQACWVGPQFQDDTATPPKWLAAHEVDLKPRP